MNDNRKLYGITALAILIFAALVWNWFDAGQYSDDPAVAEIERMRDANIGKKLTPEEQRAQGQEIREKMRGLSPEQQQSIFESSMPIWIPMMAKQFEDRYDKLMAMTPEEQRKEMDKRIDEMEARGGPPGGGPGGGGRPQMDPKKMDEFRKKMLDWTTPDQRSKFENGMKMFNERRKERGLQPLPPFGGGGF